MVMSLVTNRPRAHPPSSMWSIVTTLQPGQRPNILLQQWWICSLGKLQVRDWLKSSPKVVENNWAKTLCDFRFQTDKQMLANQPDIVVVDKDPRTAVVINVAIPTGIKNGKKH